jgi:hypothetical protein
MHKGKVFCVGLNKTATSSLGRALDIIGYRVKSWKKVRNVNEAKKEAKKYLKEYDALQDLPWPIIYKWLDKNYPKSKFILTVRDEKKWIKSICNYYDEKNELNKLAYGYGNPNGNEKKYVKKYSKHNDKVKNYFGDNKNKLLVMNITESDGWSKLCNFLDTKKPPFSFPKKNTSTKSGKVDKGNNIRQMYRHYQHIIRGRLLFRMKKRLLGEWKDI